MGVPGSVALNLYKYFSPERVDVLKHAKVRYTQPAAFNDPFEMHPYIEGIWSEASLEAKLPQIYEEELRSMYGKLPRRERRRQTFEEFQARMPPRELIANTVRWEVNSDAFLKDVRYALPKALNETLGILCLTKSPRNLLMWAHYGCSHTGFILEFNALHPYFCNDPTFTKEDILNALSSEEGLQGDRGRLLSVKYQQNRPTISNTSEATFDVFLTKSEVWAYEDEWRHLKVLKDGMAGFVDGQGWPVHLFPIPRDAITAIVLGCNASQHLLDEVRQTLKSEPEYAHVALWKMALDPKHYELRPQQMLI